MEKARSPFEMPPDLEPADPVVPRDSSTVIVLRDDCGDLEVFMLERHLQSDFAGGAYVFPGGTLDEADLDPALAGLVDGWEELAAQMNESPEVARALAVCAIRETFEEAGILIARHADGTPVQLDDPAWQDRRRDLAARVLTSVTLANETGIRYAADLLRFWQRWITPVFAPRRYDTRFFIALMPAGQAPLHDDVETTASTWVRPAEAIARGRAGQLVIIFPTRKTLESLLPHETADAVFAAAVDRPTDAVLPRFVVEDGQGRVYLPGDPTPHEP
ncbi:MAG: NUDIX hydrolase [Actinomycetota bacterium]